MGAPCTLVDEADRLQRTFLDAAEAIRKQRGAAVSSPHELQDVCQLVGPEDCAKVLKAWEGLHRTILNAERSVCPVPRRQRNVVDKWSVAYIKDMNSLHVLEELLRAWNRHRSMEFVRGTARKMRSYA